MMIRSLVFIFLFLLSSCRIFSPGRAVITGSVRWFEGDLMPGPGQQQVVGKPVIRNIYFYELTNLSQAMVEDGVFFSNISVGLAGKVTSGKDGNFRLILPAGTFSVFVEEDKGLFANQFDGQGNINPVKLNQGKNNMVLRIDYMAAY